MLSATQAEQVAIEWARRLHPESSVTVEPFDLGYVVRRSVPELSHVAGVVLDTEATMIVDGTTGGITPCPNVDTATLVALYTARASATQRFSAPMLGLLRMAGWWPGRDIGAVVDAWWSRCAPAGTVLPPAVRAVVAEFGGVLLPSATLWLAPSPVDAPVTLFAVESGRAISIGAVAGRTIAMDEAGAVYVDASPSPQRVGDTFDAGLALILGLDPNAGK